MKRTLSIIALLLAALHAQAGMMLVNPYRHAAPGSYSITGTWLASNYDSSGATYSNGAGYTMKCGLTSGSYTNTATTSNPATLTLTVSGLSAGTWYCVVVQLDNAGNESNQSFELSVTKP